MAVSTLREVAEMISRFHEVPVAHKRSSRLWRGALGPALVLTIFSPSMLAAGSPAAAASSPQSLAKSYDGSFRYSDGGPAGTMTLKKVTETSSGVVGGFIRYSLGGGGKIRGSVKEKAITFDNHCLPSLGCGGNYYIKFSGTISAKGAMSGTFANVTNNSGGTWQLSSVKSS
jgi:hypothetical protein